MSKKSVLIIFPILFLFGSCRLFFPNTMFKAKSGYNFSKLDSVIQLEYKIKPADQLEIRVYSNNGYELVDVLQSIVSQKTNPITYTVNSNGFVSLPLIDSIKASGFTIQQLRARLRTVYSYYFVHPFIITDVLNRRAVVYTGSENGQVVQLTNENLSIIEVLALAGGIKGGERADRIKVIRGDLKNPKIFLIDLSTIEGMKNAGKMNVEPNDIIYVEPSENALDYLSKISQTLSTIVSIIGFYAFIASLVPKK